MKNKSGEKQLFRCYIFMMLQSVKWFGGWYKNRYEQGGT